MNEYKCDSKGEADEKANNYITGGNVKLYEVVRGEFANYVRERATKKIIIIYTW